MRTSHLLLAALAMVLVPLAGGPHASAWTSELTSTSPFAFSPAGLCSSASLPEVTPIDTGETLQSGLLYLVKGPTTTINRAFPSRIWEQPFEGTAHGVALVIPGADTQWPPSDSGTTASPDSPEAPDADRFFAAWQIVSGWRTPTVMYAPLDGPIDRVSVDLLAANWQVSALVLDHLNYVHSGQARHAWLYLIRQDASERILGQLEIEDPARISVTLPEEGEVQARTYDSTIWWFQCTPPPAIAVTKTAIPTQIAEPGGTVRFDVRVDNTSNLDLTLTSLTDDLYGPIAGEGNPLIISTTCTLPQPLTVGGSYQCSFNALVLGKPGDIQTDTVTAIAQDSLGRTARAVDQAQVEILDIPSTIVVVKTADPTHVPEPGGDVAFTVTVQNTSTVDNVTIHTVMDDRFGDIAASCRPALPANLAPGQSIVCTFTRPITGQPGDTHTNVVTASGIDDDGTPVSEDDDATVVVDDLPSRIEVVKTANPYWMYYPGGNVTYSFRVTNLSAVDVVTIETMIDTVYGDLNGQGDCSLPQTLAVGASYTCSIVRLVTGEPDTIHTNVVTASGIDDDGAAVSDQALATVTIAAIPTKVEFVYFRATVHRERIMLEWETVWEQDNWGFNLYRSTTPVPGNAELLHFEPARGSGQFEGQYYFYEDRDIVPGQIYYYWLKDVDLAGPGPGPEPVTALLPHSVYLPIVAK